MLLKQKNMLGIPWQDTANETHALVVNSVNNWNMDSEPQSFQSYVNAINSLWKDTGIQETYSKWKKMNYWVVSVSLSIFSGVSSLAYI